MKSIREWITDIHENAKTKGWWETERPIEEIFNLMHCELSEAIEEDRAGNGNFYIENGKPEGVFVELVDVIIRMFDYLGRNKDDIHIFISELDTLDNSYYIKSLAKKNLNEIVSLCHNFLSIYVNDDAIAYLLAEIFIHIKTYIKTNGGNFTELVEIKHEFNKSRPYKHNKNY